MAQIHSLMKHLCSLWPTKDCLAWYEKLRKYSVCFAESIGPPPHSKCMIPNFLISGAYIGSRDEPRLQLTLQVKDMKRHAVEGAQAATSDKRRCLRALQPPTPSEERISPWASPNERRTHPIGSFTCVLAIDSFPPSYWIYNKLTAEYVILIR